MDGQALLIGLRLVHVVGGVFWAGSVLLMAFFLLPSVRAAGPAGGEVMRQMTAVRRLPNYLLWAGVLTLGSGFWLYWRLSGGFRSEWLLSGPGLVLGTGGLLALLAWIVGLTVNAPTAKRLGALGATIQRTGAAPSEQQAAEMRQLQRRLFRATQFGAVMLLLATFSMAIGRYTW